DVLATEPVEQLAVNAGRAALPRCHGERDPLRGRLAAAATLLVEDFPLVRPETVVVDDREEVLLPLAFVARNAAQAGGDHVVDLRGLCEAGRLAVVDKRFYGDLVLVGRARAEPRCAERIEVDPCGGCGLDQKSDRDCGEACMLPKAAISCRHVRPLEMDASKSL